MEIAAERARKFGIDMYNMELPAITTLEEHLDYLDRLLAFMSSKGEYICESMFRIIRGENE